MPGVLFLLPQKLSYIPHLSAYFTYLGKVSSLRWLQSISDNHVAHMFQEKPALYLLDFFPLSGKRKKSSRFSLLLLFPIMIWIVNISIPTSSPPAAPGPFLEDQQTPSAPINQEGSELQPAASGNPASDLKSQGDVKGLYKTPHVRTSLDLHNQSWKRRAATRGVTTGRRHREAAEGAEWWQTQCKAEPEQSW